MVFLPFEDPHSSGMISIFSFGNSNKVWIDAEKTMKKPLLHHHHLYIKSQICIGIAKIEKLKTWLGAPF